MHHENNAMDWNMIYNALRFMNIILDKQWCWANIIFFSMHVILNVWSHICLYFFWWLKLWNQQMKSDFIKILFLLRIINKKFWNFVQICLCFISDRRIIISSELSDTS